MSDRARLESEVIAAMNAAETRLMEWGKDDCALWVADILRPVLDYDPAKSFRGRYRTRRGSMRALGRKGLIGAIKQVARRNGWERIHPTFAQPGDVGLAWTTMEVPGQAPKLTLATVVCRSRGWFVGRNDRGFTGIRADKIAVAWSVLPDALPITGRATLPAISIRPQMVPTSAVAHEPVSAAIGLTALLGSFFGFSTAVAAAIGGFLVTSVLSVGLSLAASLLRPSTGSSLDPSISDASNIRAVQITERQPIPVKRVVVGSAFVGGALFFESIKAPYLTLGILVCNGQIEGIEKVFIGTNQLTFSAITADTILTPLAVVDQPNYASRLRASFRYGSDSQTVDPLILDQYASIGSEFRQRGIATVVFEYHYGSDQDEFISLWGQVARPNAYMVVRGVVCYDPRDPLQDIDDETTWQWTNNATLIQAYYLTRSWGGRIPNGKMRWDKVAISANYDDELIGCADGTMIKRHTIDGVITFNQRPFEVINKLLTANRAMIIESGGKVWIESSRPKTSIATIHDRILASGIKYEAARLKSDLVNKLQVRFVAPDQEYQLVDGPILSRTDLQTTDDEVLTATLALEYTTDHRRAQRLQKAFLASSRLGRTITCAVELGLIGLVAENANEELIGNVVTVDSQLFDKANGTYLVTSVGFSDDCTTLSLALTEYDSTIETDWNFETDEQEFTLSDVDLS